jgi:hypothetical protein
MSLFIRDSIGPGDGCFPGGSCGLVIRDIPEQNPFMVTMGMEDIPEAYVNACGNDFGERVVVEGDWFFYEEADEDIPSPLAFIPSISGSNYVRVKLTVTFPDYTPADPGAEG